MAVRPDEHDDPVAAVLAARRRGDRLSLATSGTTGAVRRVVRSTDSWWDSFPAYGALSGVASGSRVWLPGPLSSTMVLFAAVHAAVAGAVVVADPREAGHACLTPAQLALRGGQLPRGARVVVAGAALSQPLAARAAADGLVVRRYYGAAELSFVAAGGRGDDGLRAFPGVEIEVRELPVRGSIWVRSRWVCEGYESPAGASAATGPLVRDGEWATVGDVGRLRDGVLEVLGRPDAVTTAGATVLVAEVEDELQGHARGPFAVHGVPHPTLGEVLAVTHVDPADRARLEEASRGFRTSHRPRVWRRVEALPLTPAGKLDRAALGVVTRDVPGPAT